jgi:hypothetical protein
MYEVCWMAGALCGWHHTWMRIGVKVSMLKQLPQRALDTNIHKICDALACRIHSAFVCELDAIYPFHREHKP